MILVTKDTKGKIRIVDITYEWDNAENCFFIHRITCQYGGKKTIQPLVRIDKGKAKRTVTEQCKLEFASHVKKYLDKGYKQLPDTISTTDITKIDEFVGDNKTNQDGILKPMNAKQADKVASSAFNKEYYGSRKINGTRCLIYYKDNDIHTASRGSISYDIAIYHIISNPKLEEFFKKHPEVILDGEIYKHGWTLNKISGICRTQATVDDGKDLQFYWYDIVDLEKPFTERYKLLQEYGEELGLAEFDPYRCFDDDELAIQLLPHEKVTGWVNMKFMHDRFVKDGWEGLVIRKADSLYGPGKRTNDWIKIKEYKDAEYEIVGLSEGLRDEDMCFIMKTTNGQEFKAKPMGDRDQKQWYRDNIDSLIGKMGTLKYFEMSGKAGSEIPQQPIFINVRDYE